MVLAIAFTVYATLKNVYDDDDDDGMVLEGSRCLGGTNISTLGMMDHSDRGWTVDSKQDRTVILMDLNDRPRPRHEAACGLIPTSRRPSFD